MIVSAKFANPSKTAVIVETYTDPSVLIDLVSDTDNSGGLREEYLAWTAQGNKPEEFSHVD